MIDINTNTKTNDSRQSTLHHNNFFTYLLILEKIKTNTKIETKRNFSLRPVLLQNNFFTQHLTFSYEDQCKDKDKDR